MIESIKDLGITGEEELEQLDAIFQEKLGIGFINMVIALSESLHDRAEEIASQFLVMTPNGDYTRLIEDQDKMAQFLRQEAGKGENWHPVYIGTSRDPKLPNMIEVLFANKAVDDGDALMGYVFLNYSGKMLHVFVQGEP